MNFLLPEELIEFRATLHGFFSDRYGSIALRKHLLDDDGRRSEATSASILTDWKDLTDSGVLLAVLPEKLDGLGFGTLAATMALHESGATCCPVPLFENAALGIFPLLLLGHDDVIKRLLPTVADATVRVTGSCDIDGAKVTAKKTAEGKYSLSGFVNFIPSIDVSDLLVVPATLEKEADRRLFLLERNVLEPTAITSEITFDLLRPYSRIALNDAPAELCSRDGVTEDDWGSLFDHISLCAISEAQGCAERALTLSVEYAKTREQFGQPIGKYQAISHKLADMYVSLEAITSLTRFAAQCSTDDLPQFRTVAAALRGLASDFLPKIVQDAIQAHGGIGFTSEYDLHLFVRRVRTICGLFCNRSEDYSRVVDLTLQNA